MKNRSYEKELLDRHDIPFDDIRANMQELDLINTYLGGHKITINGVKELIRSIKVSDNHQSISITEIGSGGGDNLISIKKWCNKNGVKVSLIGIDINPACVRYAGSKTGAEDIRFICSDYQDVKFDQQPDILFSSLFCHHFTDPELVTMFHWFEENSRVGYFINDLQRNPIAYHSIHWLTQLFSRSYLVKNDAPLSVKRGFYRSELQELFRKASINGVQIQWKWAFRWLVIRRKMMSEGIHHRV